MDAARTLCDTMKVRFRNMVLLRGATQLPPELDRGGAIGVPQSIEQFDRASWFLTQAMGPDPPPPVKHVFLVAALYFARAVIEQWLNGVRMMTGEASKEAGELEDLTGRVKWSQLIKELRIHDFHRQPLQDFSNTPEGLGLETRVGPIEVAPQGASPPSFGVKQGEEHVDIHLEGDIDVHPDKGTTAGQLCHDSKKGYLDPVSGDWVHLETAVREFLQDIEKLGPGVIDLLERCYRPQPSGDATAAGQSSPPTSQSP
jgi:hypothetical protein